MLLKKIIKNCPKNLERIKVKGLSSDTRNLKKGELFFALKGSVYNGEKYLNIALKKGACAVVSSVKKNKNHNVIKVSNVKSCLGESCSKFYYKKPQNIIAVTGTNGKSSVADFFHQILNLNNIKVATIGTLGVKIKSFKKKNLTSPDVISLHKELFKLKQKKIENVMVEASSHGLDQGRLNGINFKAGIFTNLSQDHLDYHKSIKNYLNSKLVLFNKLLKKKSFVITDSNIPEFKKIKKISIKKGFKIRSIQSLKNNYNFNNFSLIGDFQKKNLSMSIIACEILGLNSINISKCFNKLKSVKGRLELVKKFSDNSKVFIDFAHTPDAIKNVLNTLKTNYKKNISIVFGCGGERDKGKRKKIGRIVNKLCDKIYVTDDNPRNENPAKIRRSIITEIDKKKVTEIGKRDKAIYSAIKNSSPNTLILIAGKGHETIQDYGKNKIKISDHKIVSKIKLEKNSSKKIINKQINNLLINKILNTHSNIKFLGVSINSKTLKKDNLFIAIKGKRNDGHYYLKEAFSKGASGCVVSKNNFQISSKKNVRVDNTFKFLNKLAVLKRNYFNAKIIAVTGSSGKTSVKDLIGNLLNVFGKTYFSPKSYNNQYGVPLSLCNLENTHKYGVFEIGMNKTGEIGKLSKLVKPDLGIITNVAEAHIENFKNLDQIAEAKSEIIDNISQTGSLIIDRDSKFFDFFKSKAEKKKINITSVGFNKNSNIRILKYKNYPKFKKITIQSFNNKYQFKIRGHHVKNILFAIAVFENLNLDFDKIKNKLNKLETLEGRGKIFKIKHNNLNFNLIDESYNANPLSMKESILKLSKMNIKNNKYILLGDMLELGTKTHILHKKLSPIINESKINKLFVLGNHIMDTYKHVKKSKRGNILQFRSDVKEIIFPILQNNDYLMIKGSNATGLNKISKNLSRGNINAI